MSNPRNYRSLDDANTNGPGDEVRANGHYHVTLFVSAATLDTAGGDTLTVSLEGSPDGNRWDSIDDDQGTEISISEADLDTDPESGEDTASLTHRGAYYEFLRARLSNFNDSGSGVTVDAYVMAGGNAGQGVKGQPHGP